MDRLRRFALAGIAASLIGGAIGIGTTAGAAGGSGWTITPVVTGLALPRGVAFDGLGAMYVAESGLPGSGAQGLTQGAVDKYSISGSPQRLWSTPFTSAFLTEGPGVDVIGPAGLSAVGSGCTRNHSGERNGCQVLAIVGLSSHEVQGGPAGHLFRLDAATGSTTDRSDVGDQTYQWTADHQDLFPSDFPDANPYGVLVTHGGSAASGNTFVVDAAANTVNEISADGTARVIAFIPNETPAAGLPLRDSTPTCAAQGPDGALYIGTLDLLRNFADPNQGWSHVYRVDPNSGENYLTAAHVWASGLTTITSCAFDSAGNFWATEMFKNNGAAPPGDVVRIPFADPSSPEHIGGGQLPFPGGIAQGGDGAIYASVFSAGTTAANGAVMRLAAG
jgi:hypothetical protein